MCPVFINDHRPGKELPLNKGTACVWLGSPRLHATRPCQLLCTQSPCVHQYARQRFWNKAVS